jgi:hypothetical protein
MDCVLTLVALINQAAAQTAPGRLDASTLIATPAAALEPKLSGLEHAANPRGAAAP